MYSLFDYMLSPPMRTVVVVTEDKLKDLQRKQITDEISINQRQQEELEAAFTRRKQSLNDSLAHLESQLKAIEPVKTTRKKVVTSK
tara:strand:+ start:269 stop:526 length:258 start_codon:yes stop_codon:yes gene_type:complete